MQAVSSDSLVTVAAAAFADGLGITRAVCPQEMVVAGNQRWTKQLFTVSWVWGNAIPPELKHLETFRLA